MADIVDSRERIDKLLAQQDRRIAAAFRAAIADLKGNVDLDEIADMIEAGNIEAAIDRLTAAARATGIAYNSAFIGAGESTASFLRDNGFIAVFFNQVNNQAVAAMQANQLRLIREFTDEQRQATQIAIVEGLRRGDNPRQQARNFRDSIGLTGSQQQAVDTYRRSLESIGRGSNAASNALGRALRDKRGDASVARAVRNSEPIPAARVDWMVKRYTEKYVKYRSEVIGRTEALSAVHQGDRAMFEQAIAAGHFAREDLTRQWHTSVDGRERRTHRLLNTVKRGFDQPWETANGTIMFPGDPGAPLVEIIQCRCSATTRIKRRKN